MSLDLSSLDQSINNNLTAQTATDNSVTLPIEPTVLSPEQAELERLRAENAELKQQQLEGERAQRLKSAVAASNVRDSGPTAGELAARRQRAITQSGGVAKWYKIPVADRVNILLDGQRVLATVEEIKKYFGPNTSAAALQLKATNPRAYRSYRTEAIELGLI